MSLIKVSRVLLKSSQIEKKNSSMEKEKMYFLIQRKCIQKFKL